MDEDRRYTLAEVIQIVTGHVLNDIRIEDAEALKMVQFYPAFESFIGKSLKQGVKIRYDGKLYETRRGITGITGKVTPADDQKAYRLIQKEGA